MGLITSLAFGFLLNTWVFKSSRADKQPNIVFVLSDDYGWNDIGYHGSEIKTPTLDKLAGDGVKLDSYYVTPICSPSRSVLMTGRYQIHLGLQHGILWPTQPNCLPLDVPTLPDKLRQVGYANHMVGKWHLGFYKPECTPLRRGFDSFYGFLGGGQDYYSHTYCKYMPDLDGQYKYCGYDMRNNYTVDRSQDGVYSTHLFTSKSQDVIKNHAASSKKPLFLYLSYQAVHDPMQVPESYLKPYTQIKNKKRQIYAGMTAAMDEGINNITQTLKDTGLWENTVFVFSTDNGAQVWGGGNNWPLRGWKWSLWEGGVRGVGFVSSPLLKKKGYTSNKLMHISDWYPTLLGLAGGSPADMHGLDGVDQWSSLSTDSPSPRKQVLHNLDSMWSKQGSRLHDDTFDNRQRAAIRVGDYKLITGYPGNSTWIPVPDLKSGNETAVFPKDQHNKNIWLFNLVEDPEEKSDLSEKHPDIVRRLLNELARYEKTALPVVYPPHDPESDPGQRDGVWGPWVEDEQTLSSGTGLGGMYDYMWWYIKLVVVVIVICLCAFKFRPINRKLSNVARKLF